MTQLPPPPPAVPPPLPPGPPGGSGPRGGRGWRRTPPWAISFVVSFLAGCLGVAGWLALVPADGSASAPQGTAAPSHRTHTALSWTRPAETEGLDDSRPTAGTWFTARHVIKAQSRRIVAYALETGKPAWTVPLRGTVCGTSLEAVGGRAAVQHGAQCERLSVIDLAAHRLLWTVRVPYAGGDDDALRYTAEVGVTRTTVGSATSEGAAVYRLRDHHPTYRTRQDDACEPVGFRGGPQLVARVHCEWSHATQVWGFGADSGRRAWNWSSPGGADVVGVASTRPVVVGMATTTEGDVDLITALGREGRSTVRIETRRESEYLCSGADPRCSGIVVGGGTVYVTGREHSSAGDGDATVNDVLAYDVRTGEEKWVGEPEEKRGLLPFATLDGDLLAYEPATGEKGGAVVRYDARTGHRSLHERHSDEDSEQEERADRKLAPLVHGGGSFLVLDELDPLDADEPTAERPPLLMAFR